MYYFEFNKVREESFILVSFNLASERVAAVPAAPSATAGRRQLRWFSPVRPGFGSPRKARSTPGTRVAVGRRTRPHASPFLRAISGACCSRVAVLASGAVPSGPGSLAVTSWTWFAVFPLKRPPLDLFFSFSGTPTITTAKLNWKNYPSWSASVELWFLGQGHHDHLEKTSDSISDDKRAEWEKLDYQLCAVLWQSVESDILEILRSFKSCRSFWKKAQEIFANDIQSLFDATMKVTALKQTGHDMIAHVGKARAAVEELRKFLVADSLEEVNRKLDKFYMVLILRSLHSDFDHVRDQVLAGDQIPSMDSLITRLLRVPYLLKDENPTDGVETSAMVASRGRGSGRNSRGGRSGRGGRPHCTYCKRIGHTQETCYSLHGFPDKVAQVSKSEKAESRFSDEEYQEYLKLKSEKPSNQAQPSSVPCFSTACISQSIEGHSPWILDSGASDHISDIAVHLLCLWLAGIPNPLSSLPTMPGTRSYQPVPSLFPGCISYPTDIFLLASGLQPI
ncbi:Retrovirus-related Pol polyprotein from transposon TNT 1-94 [Glycine soja]